MLMYEVCIIKFCLITLCFWQGTLIPVTSVSKMVLWYLGVVVVVVCNITPSLSVAQDDKCKSSHIT